jgi:ABC-2 type transport system permease protein
MIRLLSIEFRKMWHNKASRILTFAYFILLSFIALLSSVNFSFIGLNFHLADMGIFNFPFIWHLNTFVAGFLKFFLAFVIVSMIANEYSYGTLKQNLIDGLTKKEFLLSKCYAIAALSAVSTLFVFVMTLVLGYAYSSYTEPSIVFSDLSYLGAYFLKLLEFGAMCLFLAVLIKRSAFAIGFFVVWFFAEQIIIHAFDLPKTVTNLLPLEAMSNLIREPISRFSAYKALEHQISGKAAVRDYSVHIGTMLIAAGWTVIFMLMSYKILQKRDL